MKWSETAWAGSGEIYAQIQHMPFIRSLIDGSLEQEKFRFYIAQDSNYLAHFGRALSIIAAKAHDKEHVLDFIRFAEGAIVVESALHKTYFEQLHVVKQLPLSPTCHHYTTYLLSTAMMQPVETAMAAVLPCFRIYKEVGDFILQHDIAVDHPYRQWIDTYGGEAFAALVTRATAICDEVAETCTLLQREAMTAAFITACKLEWMFWDSAWNIEQWPV